MKLRRKLHKKTKEQIAYNMSKVRSVGSKIERLLGKAMWAEGLRYRKQYKIFGRPDYAIVKDKVAIFCDSSFWHGYNLKNSKRHIFRTNQKFWVTKIKKNIERDKAVNKQLKKEGWHVFRFWDFEIQQDVGRCVYKIKSSLMREARNGL